MNVWIINNYAMPPEYEVRIRNNVMAKYLQELGYSVKIISASTIHNTNINLMNDSKLKIIEKIYDRLNFVHIKTSNYNDNGIRRIINHLQFTIRLLLNYRNISSKPDIILCNLVMPFTIIPYFISRKTKAQLIFEVRDLWPESFVAYGLIKKKNLLLRLLYMGEKWIYRKCDKLIFTMEGGKDYIIEHGWDKEHCGPVDMNKVFHINNGVDLEMFNLNRVHFKIVDEDLDDLDTFKIIYAGSFRLADNVKSIVNVAKEIKKTGVYNVKFIMYGDGNDRISLEQYCVDNNIDNISFKGFIDKKYIPYVLSKSDLNIIHFEQNTLKRYGVSPNKLFEYFASGKPILSDCEFGYDLINRYQCGVVIDNGSPEQLAEAILRISKMSSDEYNELSTNSTRAAQDYDYKKLTNKLIELIRCEAKVYGGLINEQYINE